MKQKLSVSPPAVATTAQDAHLQGCVQSRWAGWQACFSILTRTYSHLITYAQACDG